MPLSLFFKDKYASDSLTSKCKNCFKEYYLTNNKRIRTQQTAYKIENREKHLEGTHKFYQEHKDQWVKRAQDNFEEIKHYQKEYRASHSEEINQQRAERKKKDPLFRMSLNLRTRLNIALKKTHWNKSVKFNDYIGCTLEELKTHLEKQFKPGMTWENNTLTGWHIDHIIPLASAKTEEELYKLCHYTNLQPLWAKDNLRKHSKYDN